MFKFLKIVFLNSQPKHMLWLLKRTVSMRGLFRAQKTNDKTHRLENSHSYAQMFCLP